MSQKCDYCGHEGQPEAADYYGTEIEVCENCEAEL